MLGRRQRADRDIAIDAITRASLLVQSEERHVISIHRAFVGQPHIGDAAHIEQSNAGIQHNDDGAHRRNAATEEIDTDQRIQCRGCTECTERTPHQRNVPMH